MNHYTILIHIFLHCICLFSDLSTCKNVHGCWSILNGEMATISIKMSIYIEHLEWNLKKYIHKMAAKEGLQVEYKGVSYQFTVDIPTTLLCSVCLELCSDPQQAVCCGKLFCLGCIEKAKALNVSCPCCRQFLRTFPDKRTEQDIGDFRTVCPNVVRGCQETPELRDAPKHREVCPLELVLYQFSDVGCPKTMLRRESEDHNIRNVIQHLDLCRKKIATIPLLEKEISNVKALLNGKDARKQGSQAQVEEKVVPSQPTRVFKIEVNHHNQMAQRRWLWTSAPLVADQWTFTFSLQFGDNGGIDLLLKLVKGPPSCEIEGANAKVDGECELLTTSDDRVLKFEPFQTIFTRGDAECWKPIRRIGIYQSQKGREGLPLVVYKLSIWHVGLH